MISRSHVSQDLQAFDKIVADVAYQWSDSEPEVDTDGIYVENHHGVNRECFIWVRFAHKTLGEKGSLPYLLEDPLISETCPLEEIASHHFWRLRRPCGHVSWSQTPSTSMFFMKPKPLQQQIFVTRTSVVMSSFLDTSNVSAPSFITS